MQHRRKALKSGRPEGDYVLYWMQASVRVTANLALAEAQGRAQELGLPLAVLFCLDGNYPEANERSLAFLLDGLADVHKRLQDRGLALVVALGEPLATLAVAVRGAATLVFDRGYLPHQRAWRSRVASLVAVPVVEVEDNAGVPVETVSDHEEWAAATLRPKLMRLAGLDPYQGDRAPTSAARALVEGRWAEGGLTLVDPARGRDLLARLGPDASVAPTNLVGGETAALELWSAFRDGKLEAYDRDRNDPNLAGGSGLAPYLHYGQLSPLTLLADLKAQGRWVEALSYRRAGEDPVSKFLDEVLVRRELSLNFVWFNPRFATFDGLPEWAKKTLADHAGDRREHLYGLEAWEGARTHDAAWNAAQTQLVSTGTIHGYLRMYWGKKLLEWSADPAQAFAWALELNNKYALDGRDPNSYAGVAWCFGKHDRPWGERSVYGLVRCMTAGGLARKFDLARWVESVTRPSPAAPAQPGLPF